jgi:cell division control protein 45
MTPIANYSEMLSAASEFIELHDGNVILVLVDCGASANLRAELELDQPGREGVSVVVYDAHRPIHHVNLRQSNVAVRIQLDKNDELDDIPIDFEDESDEEDEDDADTAAAAVSPRKRARLRERRRVRRRLSPADDVEEEAGADDDEDLEEDEDEDDDEEDSQATPRPSRADRERDRRVLEEYYRTQQFAAPAAVTLHSLAVLKGRQTRDGAWLAALGLTEQWSLERVGRANYALAYQQLVDEVNQVLAAEAAEAETSEENPVQMLRQGRVSASTELVFPLYRHWTLFDSMAHARHVAVALRMWTQLGDTQLKTVLAKIGIPLRDAQRPFLLMTQKLRRQFVANLGTFGPTIGLTDNTVESFVRLQSTSFTLSAPDAVLALAALIAAPHAATGTAPAAPAPSPLADADDELPGATAGSKDRFWMAMDALTQPGGALLKRGVDLAIAQLKAVVRQGVAMVTKREVDTRNIIHYAKLEASPDLGYFAHPDHLLKLGFFVLDLVALKKVSRPLVLGALLPGGRSYLVVGLNACKAGAPRQAATRFVSAFRRAAELIGAATRSDAFDGSVVVVRRADWDMFVEQLVLVFTAEATIRRY